MPESEVAKFRQLQVSHKQAAQRGLYGLVVVANHESITAHMEIGAVWEEVENAGSAIL